MDHICQKSMSFSGNYDRKACLSLVQQSPMAVAAHDRAAWLGLFAKCNIVEDPVGSAPHLSGTHDDFSSRGNGGSLGHFYDTFIAPNDICFHVDRDIVCGLNVVRDLTIEINMASSVTVRTPMHLLYELMEEDGELKIFRLAAHWEMLPALRQQMASGSSGLATGLASGGRMLRYLGIGGTVGFLRALSSIGNAGKDRVRTFAEYFNRREGHALRSLFADPGAVIEFPLGGRALSAAELVQQGGELVFGKFISAGNCTSASLRYMTGTAEREGVAFFEFDRETVRIVSLSLYWEE
jgi:hypothetical protein